MDQSQMCCGTKLVQGQEGQVWQGTQGGRRWRHRDHHELTQLYTQCTGWPIPRSSAPLSFTLVIYFKSCLHRTLHLQMFKMAAVHWDAPPRSFFLIHSSATWLEPGLSRLWYYTFLTLIVLWAGECSTTTGWVGLGWGWAMHEAIVVSDCVNVPVCLLQQHLSQNLELRTNVE